MMQRLFKLHTTLMKKGNVESMVKLGIMYQRGEGVSKNSKKARQLFKQAASLGNKSAIELLNKSSENKLDDHLKLRTFSKAVPKRRVKNIVNPPVAEKQWQIDNRIAREKADTETTIIAVENQKRAQQFELKKKLALDKQNQLETQRLKVQQAREHWVRERAEALEINREIELATTKKQAEEKSKLKALADQQQEIDKLLAEKEQAEKPQEKQQKTFSSNPCDTPAAKFMSTCL